MTTTPALDRLAEMVRRAETKSRAQKLGAEAEKAAERFQAAETRARAAEQRLREDRPAREREIEALAADEVRLKDLIRKVTALIASGSLGPEDRHAVEKETEASRLEIEAKRKEAQADLDAILKEAEDARRELRLARESYQQVRRELDEVRPELVDDFAQVDRLVVETESNSPVAQIQALAREVNDGERHFGMLEKGEQLAQLKIWVGRFRKIQDRFRDEDVSAATEEDRSLLHQTFPRLVGISKDYWPGYIEAFSRGFTTDWDRYIEDAQEELRLASEAARRYKDLEDRRQSQEARLLEQKRQSRALAADSMEELKRLVARPDFPEQGFEQFAALLAQVIQGFGVSDPEVRRIAYPYRELLTGKDFRALRRHLDQAHAVESEAEEDQALREEFRDVLPLTRGKKALMIGGSAREESRKALQQFFEFRELEWESHEGTRPALLKSLEERVRNRGMDLLLILKEFVGHIVPGRLRPLCEQYGIPCLMVEKGYGARQMGETIRWGLKTQSPGAQASADGE